MKAVAPEEHSSLVGGSTAGRRIACPASYHMEAKVPASVRNASTPDADEGTALHSAMTFAIFQEMRPEHLDGELKGLAFDGLVITQEHVDEALRPALETFDSVLLDMDPDNLGVDLLIENRVEMPGIPDAFGTADVIVKGPRSSAIVDWKFGVGVPVSAYYKTGGNDERLVQHIGPNPQLAFYARGAMHTFPHMFEDRHDWPVDLHVVQPRVREGAPHSVYHAAMGALEEFRWTLIRAVAEAKGDAPHMERGEHCRFAPCKTICPLWVPQALDLTKMHDTLTAKKGGLASIRIDWSLMYGELLTLADMAEAVVAEVRAQAHVFMSEGNKVEGYKLVDKRATRKWADPATVADDLTDIGATHDDIFTEPELRSPKQVEDRIKKRKLKLPGQLVIAVSSGTTIASEGDKRENVIPTAGHIFQLSEQLRQLK